MAYIGRQPTVGNFRICDAISVVNGQAAYTMQVGGTNVIPESHNNMIVSLNGVIQKPGSSFTVASSTITFSSNLSTGDVIDFIQILGDVANIGTPTDGTVTAAKLVDGAVSNAKLANSSITLNSSAVSLGGSHTLANTPSWMVKRSANQSISNQVDTVLAFDQERFDTDSAYDNSTNYRFTVPSGKDGKYFVFALVSLTNFATNKPVNVSVRKNGSGFAAFQQISGDYSDDCAAYVSQIFDASAGDYFDATCFHRGGSSFNANTNTCFGGYKLL